MGNERASKRRTARAFAKITGWSISHIWRIIQDKKATAAEIAILKSHRGTHGFARGLEVTK